MAAIADQAILRGTGARGLRAIMEEVLLNVMYELPSREDVTKCLVDEDVVLVGREPDTRAHGLQARAQGALRLAEFGRGSRVLSWRRSCRSAYPSRHERR